jgi:hypothetical protein
LLAQRIAAPLGMHDTGVTMSARMQSLLAPGHDGAGKQVKNWNLAVLAGAGGVRSNAHDMLLYLQAHMRAMPPPAPLGLRAVWQDQRGARADSERIGLVWQLHTVRGKSIVSHNGMTGGYAAFVGFSADGQHGVVVLANASIAVNDIGMRALVGGDPAAAAAAAPASSEAAPVAGAPATLAPYVGRYQLAPGMIFEVSVGDNGLLVQLTGQPAAPVYARKPDEFFYKVVDASLRFERAADGTVSAVTLLQNGRSMRSPRLTGAQATPPPARAEVALEPALLREYVGSYQIAPSLRAVLTLEGGQLFLQATGQARSPVYAWRRDEIFWRVDAIEASFQRDAGGTVSGMVIHQNGSDSVAPRVPNY